MKYYYFIFVVIICISCNNSNDLHCQKCVDVSFDVVEIDSLLLALPIGVDIIDTLLIINDFKTDPMLTMINVKNNTIVDRKLMIGRANNEMMPPVEVKIHNDSLFMLERQSSTISISPTILGGDIDKLCQTELRIDAFLPMRRNLFLTAGMLDKGRFFLINHKGVAQAISGEYPQYSNEESNYPNQIKGMIHQTKLYRRNEGDEVLAASTHSLEVYTFNENCLQLKYNLLLSPYKYTFQTGKITYVQATSNTPRGVIDTQVSNKYIYVLYNPNDSNSQKELNNVILVFNWELEHIKTLRLDCIIDEISTPISDSLIYAVDSENQIIKITIR